ncbi:hypothetical protein LWI29_008913 [Acer saccharum]|uniref:Uncharacterized protein n=1 Tax=Acer saccharum TaxID=4024 RepID=A0AA39RL42_ACESA|nr:hypothetical protein LWI29_008913 [Acer saccharum]
MLGRTQSESKTPSSSCGPTIDPFDMLHFISVGKGYIGNGYWNDPRKANNSERIRSIFNNRVYAVEEVIQALITQDRQAVEISRLKKELIEKDDKIKSSSIEKL